MRHRAVIAGWRLSLLLLLAAQAGCSWLSLRPGNAQTPPTAEQVARTQQISEHAQAAIDRGDYPQAQVDLLQLVAEAPSSAEAQQRLGTVLQLEGRLSEAENCFRTAIDHDPEYVDALIGLGQVEAQKNDVASAIKRFETAIEIDPATVPRLHFCLGLWPFARRNVAGRRRTMAEYSSSTRILTRTTRKSACGSPRFSWPAISSDQALSRGWTRWWSSPPRTATPATFAAAAHLALRHFPQAIEDFRAAASVAYPTGQTSIAPPGGTGPRSRPQTGRCPPRSGTEALRLAPNYPRRPRTPYRTPAAAGR